MTVATRRVVQSSPRKPNASAPWASKARSLGWWAAAKRGRGSATVITLTREMAEDVHGITRPEIERARAILRDGQASAEAPTRPVSPRSLGGYLVGLTAVREAAGLTKTELARRAGLSRETVSRLEALRRPAEPATVRALAAALEVEPIVLVTP